MKTKVVMLNKLGDIMKARNSIIFMGIFIFSFVYGNEANFTIYHDQSLPLEEKFGYIFAHGLGATQEQASLFLPNNSNKWLIYQPTILFDFPDAKNNAMEYHSQLVNLGQKLDIMRLKDMLEKALALLPDLLVVGAGISRGAAALLNYVALFQPDSIAGLVLESPFDTLTNVIKHLLRRFHLEWVPGSEKLALKIAKSTFPLLDFQGIFPINVVHKIQSHIPIMLIHSRKDRTIPVNSSRNLYRSLVLAGHKNVYFLELASGDHGKLVHSIESDLYATVLHAFYKKYGLPHTPQLAQNGENMLRHCQPTLQEINKKIKKSKNNNEEFNDDVVPIQGYDDYLTKNNIFELDILPFATKIQALF